MTLPLFLSAVDMQPRPIVFLTTKTVLKKNPKTTVRPGLRVSSRQCMRTGRGYTHGAHTRELVRRRQDAPSRSFPKGPSANRHC